MRNPNFKNRENQGRVSCLPSNNSDPGREAGSSARSVKPHASCRALPPSLGKIKINYRYIFLRKEVSPRSLQGLHVSTSVLLLGLSLWRNLRWNLLCRPGHHRLQGVKRRGDTKTKDNRFVKQRSRTRIKCPSLRNFAEGSSFSLPQHFPDAEARARSIFLNSKIAQDPVILFTCRMGPTESLYRRVGSGRSTQV